MKSKKKKIKEKKKKGFNNIFRTLSSSLSLCKLYNWKIYRRILRF